MSMPIDPVTGTPVDATTTDDVLNSIVKANAIAGQMTAQANAANLAAISTVATGTMLLKLIREPLALDSIRAITELLSGGSITPPAPAPQPAAPAPTASSPTAPAVGADPLGTGIGLEI
jgi:hypothetical protein